MKKLNTVLAMGIALSSLSHAGGDILPTFYEEEEVYIAVEEYVEPVEEYIEEAYVEPEEVYIEEEYVEPVEEYIAPEPVYIAPTPLPAPLPVPVPLANITANGLYVGLGLTAAQYKPNCNCPTSNSRDRTAGVMGKVGYDFNQYIGVEARGIRTNWKAQEGGKIKHAGVFVKPMYPVTNDLNVYALAGYAKTTTQGSLPRVNAKTFAWGTGVEYDLFSDTAKNGRYARDFDGQGDQEGGFGLFTEYERLVQKSGSPDLDTVSFGITYDF